MLNEETKLQYSIQTIYFILRFAVIFRLVCFWSNFPQ